MNSEAITAAFDDGINAVANMVWQIADEHGFHEPKVRFGEEHERMSSPMEQLMLIVSECVEAMEEVRFDGRDLGEVTYTEAGKPDGFSIELADAVIRLLDTAQYYGIDIEHAIELKSQYNNSRPFMHGKVI